jgi:hypothetical protein
MISLLKITAIQEKSYQIWVMSCPTLWITSLSQ